MMYNGELLKSFLVYECKKIPPFQNARKMAWKLSFLFFRIIESEDNILIVVSKT